MTKKMRIVGLMLLMATFLLPTIVKAQDLDLTIYSDETLQETLTEENITGDFTNYQDTDDRATIYVFRQDGCLNCKNFYQYVADTLLVNYADKFRVISYEVRNNQLNNTLRMKVQDFIGEEATITPYIIIGEKTFSGFIDAEKQSQIEDAILALYNSANKYDVLEDMKNNKKDFNDVSSGIFIRTEKALSKDYSLRIINTNTKDSTITDFNHIASYDMKILDKQNNITQINNNKITVRIPIAQSYDLYKVVEIDNNGNSIEINNIEYKDGYIIFETNDLKEYLIYGKNNATDQTPNENTPDQTGNQVTENNPNTLDNVQIYVLMFLVGSIIFVSSTYLLKHKKN